MTKDSDGSIVPLQSTSNYSIEIFDKDSFDATEGAIVGEDAQFSSNISDTGSDTGSFLSEGLEKGKEYTLAVIYTFASGEKIVLGTTDLEVKEDGQMTISTILIDPYGTITDAQTGNIIEGAEIKLYYANTERNIAAGRTPDTEVTLPLLDGFAPSNNANPQLSDSTGQYAFMVFPNADYYVKVVKSGYETYISPTISVEYEIVKHDIIMTPVPTTSNSSDNSSSGKTTIDKTKLQEEYAFSGQLHSNNYSSTSWNAYQEALKKAKSVLDNPNSTQEEIDAAQKALKEAKAALVKSKGSALPDTATNTFNWLLSGIVILAISILLFIKQRRRI